MTWQTNPTGAPPEILIVEDSPVEAEMLRRVLVRSGYRVTLATNGEDGLQALREHPCALVISDINMPRMNGYELCHAIKLDEKLWSTPVILLTMLSEPKDIIMALDVGADSYITKPFVETTLLYRIDTLLANPLRRKLADERRKIHVGYGGENYNIAASGEQMANLLLSVYESGLVLNNELTRIQNQLYLLNESLDDQVRKRTEELLAEKQNLERANRAQRTLSACNMAMVHAQNEQDLLRNICRRIVEIGGYRLAWIGFVEHDNAKSIRPVAHWGYEEGYLQTLGLTWADTARGQGPTGRAIRSGKPALVQNIPSDPAYAPWRAEAAARGYAASIALPLLEAGEVFGVLNIYAGEANVFDTAEIKLLEELGGDLAFGIVTLRTRTERDRALEGELRSAAELHRTFEQTITAIALTLEKRDPYTAGHQQRVARLAAAIATEMGCTPQQVEGIRFGAQLHNIGTVAVPAEILNRPGKLSDLQFALVKQHTQTGFEIVKDIPFPWPVAQMVLQHHERLDGSGYPQGLAGEQIMLEARILAVADVLEAMQAYRPYRAAQGLDTALDALSWERGTLFDPAVVDACLRVVQQPGYASRHSE